VKLFRLLLVFAGSSRAVVPAVLIATAGTVIAAVSDPSSSTWVGMAQNTGSYTTVFAFAVAGCLSVVAGYVAGADLARDEHALLRRGMRPVSVLVALRALGDLAWLWAGLLTAMAAAFGRTIVVGGGFRADSWSPVVLAMCSVAATYASGMLAGALLRHRVGLVVVAPLPYVATLWSSGVLSMSEHAPMQFLIAPYVDQSWFPGYVPAPGAFGALAGYVAGAAVVFLACTITFLQPRLRRRPPGAGVLVGASVVTLLAAVQVVGLGGPSSFGRPNPAGVLCTTGPAPVCVWGDQERQLPVWTAAARDTALAIEGLPVDTHRFVQTFVPLSGARDVEIQTRSPQPSVHELRTAMFDVVAQELLSSCVSPQQQAEARPDLIDLMSARVSGQRTRTAAIAEFPTITAGRCG
jgi:hypothetical protein